MATDPGVDPTSIGGPKVLGMANAWADGLSAGGELGGRPADVVASVGSPDGAVVGGGELAGSRPAGWETVSSRFWLITNMTASRSRTATSVPAQATSPRGRVRRGRVDCGRGRIRRPSGALGGDPGDTSDGGTHR